MDRREADVFDKFGEMMRGLVANFSPPAETVAMLGRTGDDETLGTKVILARDGYKRLDLDLRDPERHHRVDDVPSLIDYLERHGTPGRTTLFCRATGFVALLRDDDPRRVETVLFKPVSTAAARAWADLDGLWKNHVDFKDRVLDRAGDIIDPALLLGVQQFGYQSTVEYDADLDDGNAVTLKVKHGQKAGTAQLPKVFGVSIPVLVGWEPEYEFSYRLEFEMRDGRVYFRVSSRDRDEVMERVLNGLVTHVSNALGEDWLVVRGSPVVTPPGWDCSYSG